MSDDAKRDEDEADAAKADDAKADAAKADDAEQLTPPPTAPPLPEVPASPLDADDRGQRQVRNYLLQPPFQVQLVVYNVVLAIAFAGAVVGVLWRVKTRLAYRMDIVGVPAGLRDSLEAGLKDSAVWLALLGLIFVVACAMVTIILTHRLVGPAYAFRRQINELTSGRYDARIRLRENDAFTEVADDLNKLAETLQREHGGLSADGPIRSMDA